MRWLWGLPSSLSGVISLGWLGKKGDQRLYDSIENAEKSLRNQSLFHYGIREKESEKACSSFLEKKEAEERYSIGPIENSSSVVSRIDFKDSEEGSLSLYESLNKRFD